MLPVTEEDLQRMADRPVPASPPEYAALADAHLRDVLRVGALTGALRDGLTRDQMKIDMLRHELRDVEDHQREQQRQLTIARLEFQGRVRHRTEQLRAVQDPRAAALADWVEGTLG